MPLLPSASATVSVPRQPAAAVSALLRTVQVYIDRPTVSVAYRLEDADGCTAVAPPAALKLSLTAAGRLAGSWACGLPDAATGQGSCVAALNSTWFPTTGGNHAAAALVTALYPGGASALDAPPLAVTLVQVPAGWGLWGTVSPPPGARAPRAYFTLPSSPRLGGDAVSVRVMLDTGGAPISSWTLLLSPGPSLGFSSCGFAGSSLFNAALVGTDSSAATVKATASGAAGPLSSVNGSAVALGTLSCSVAAGARPGLDADALAVTVVDAVNEAGVSQLLGAAAWASDARGGWAPGPGQLTVAQVAPVGLFTSLAVCNLFNVAPLNPALLQPAVALVAVAAVGSYPYDPPRDPMLDLATPSGLACRAGPSLGPAVGVVSVAPSGVACLITAGAVQGAGAAGISIAASYGGFEAMAKLNVWAPSALSLFSSDSLLQPVGTAAQAAAAATGSAAAASAAACGAPAGCFGPGFFLQGARLWGTARFVAGSLPTISGDVTSLLSLSTSNASVLKVSSSATATAVSIGQATVSASTAGSLAASVTLAVGGPCVYVTNLAAFTVSAFAASFSFVPGVGPSALAVSVAASQQLSYEGAAGVVAVGAAFSDSTTAEVLPTSGLALAVAPAHAADLRLGLSPGAAYYQLSVPADARGVANDSLALVPTLPGLLPSCPALFGAGTGFVDSRLPRAIGCSVTASASALAAPGSPAASLPLALASAAQLAVQLQFADGGAEDVSSDARTVFALQSAPPGVYLSASGMVAVQSSAATPGTISLLVSFPAWALAKNVTCTAALQAVTVTGVELSWTPYPNDAGWAPNASDVSLLQLGCSGTFQHVQLSLEALRSDGGSVDVTPFAVFASSAPAAANFSAAAAPSVLAGLAPGPGSASATWRGFAASRGFSVSAESDTVTSITLPTPSNTFLAVLDGTLRVPVSLTFADGTVIADAAQGPSAAWLPLASLVALASSAPAVVSLAGDGSAQLLQNSYANVTLVASSVCTGFVNGTASGAASPLRSAPQVLSPNLSPQLHDAKLGKFSGLPFDPTAVGADVPVPIFLNVGAEILYAFHVVVEWDPALLAPSACAGIASQGYAFTCTLNNPVRQAIVLGSSATPSASNTGDALQVATLTLRVVTSAPSVATLNGTVVKLVTSATNGTAPAPMVAGLTYLSLNGGGLVSGPSSSLLAQAGRRTLLQATHPPTTVGSAPPTAGCHVLGDADGDCVFDVADVLYTQRLLVATTVNLTLLSPWQRQQLSPTLSYLDPAFDAVQLCGAMWGSPPCPTLADVQFLLYTLATFYRFLNVTDPAQIAQGSLADGVTLTAPLVHEKQGADCSQTRAQFEVQAFGGGTAGKALPVAVLNASCAGGVFTAALPAPYAAFVAARGGATVGVAVLIQSLDALLGQGAPTMMSQAFRGGSSPFYSQLYGGFRAFYNLTLPSPPPPPAPPPLSTLPLSFQPSPPGNYAFPLSPPPASPPAAALAEPRQQAPSATAQIAGSAAGGGAALLLALLALLATWRHRRQARLEYKRENAFRRGAPQTPYPAPRWEQLATTLTRMDSSRDVALQKYLIHSEPPDSEYRKEVKQPFKSLELLAPPMPPSPAAPVAPVPPIAPVPAPPELLPPPSPSPLVLRAKMQRWQKVHSPEVVLSLAALDMRARAARRQRELSNSGLGEAAETPGPVEGSNGGAVLAEAPAEGSDAPQ